MPWNLPEKGYLGKVLVGGKRPAAALLIAAALASGACSGARTRGPGPPIPADAIADTRIFEARRILAEGDDAGIVDFFRSQNADPGSFNLEAPELFIAGRAYFHAAQREIVRYRGDSQAGMGSLPEETVSMLVTARDSLLASADRQPEGPHAPEAFYLAGQSMDHGYLQDFTRALEVYRWAAGAYPDSEFGARAARRYQELSERFRSVGGSSHGK